MLAFLFFRLLLGALRIGVLGAELRRRRRRAGFGRGKGRTEVRAQCDQGLLAFLLGDGGGLVHRRRQRR